MPTINQPLPPRACSEEQVQEPVGINPFKKGVWHGGHDMTPEAKFGRCASCARALAQRQRKSRSNTSAKATIFRNIDGWSAEAREGSCRRELPYRARRYERSGRPDEAVAFQYGAKRAKSLHQRVGA